MKTTLFSKLLILFAFFIGTISCVQSQGKKVAIPQVENRKPSPNEAVATFGQGCFWHSEIVFQSLKGVRDAVSGFAGGNDTRPTYSKVCSGSTGHAEVVQVYYDPSVVKFETLVKAFFASMNPTTLNRQGNDIGSQYRSVAFYRNDSERKIIQAEIDRINASKKYSSPVVTEVKPFVTFYPAEEYHQEYIFNHPDNPYVQGVSIPDYMEFRKEFAGPYKN